MKKIIAILLALLCMVSVVSMVACGDDPGVEEPQVDTVLEGIVNGYKNAVADASTAKIVYQSEDGTTVYHEMEVAIDKTGEDKDANLITIYPYNSAYVDENGKITMPEEPTTEISANPTASTTMDLSALNISAECFKDGTYVYADGEFKATIADCAKFFGTAVSMTEAEITMTIENEAPKTVTIEYTSALGYEVEISIEF